MCYLKNFHIMEPLDEMGATGESILNREEAVVASVRSAMRELQESIQDLCKAGLAKIVTIGQSFSSLLFSSLLNTFPFRCSESRPCCSNSYWCSSSSSSSSRHYSS